MSVLKLCRVLILGQTDTGKTSIVMCRNGVSITLIRPEQTTVIETYVFDRSENENTTTYLIDMPGKVSTKTIETYLRDANAVLLVYNCISPDSYSYIFKTLEPILKNFSHLKIVLVATFVDLQHMHHYARQLPKTNGPEEAKHRGWDYYEVTYKKPHVISQMFQQIESELIIKNNFTAIVRHERKECGILSCCSKR